MHNLNVTDVMSIMFCFVFKTHGGRERRRRINYYCMSICAVKTAYAIAPDTIILFMIDRKTCTLS